MTEIILLILVVLTMLTTYCLYKMLDKRGLYFSLVLMNVITFVLSFKISNVFKMNINLNIISLTQIFTILYIFISKYSSKENKNIIFISLYSNIIVSVLLAIMNFFVPAITETISISMQGTFEYNYKILIIYPIIMALSQLIVIKLYGLVNKIQNNIPICVILTYIITALLYTVIFYAISYINILDIKYSLYLGISTYIVGLPLTICNIPLIDNIVNKQVINK